MLPYTIVLRNLDPRSLHRQIVQLEAMQRDLDDEYSVHADSVRQTVQLLHMIEEEVRRQARALHPH